MRAYFDHNATTPLDPEAAEVMVRVLREQFGNASSVHRFGQEAKTVLDEARTSIARLIGAEPSELVFTSGGTEADNLALRGVAEALEAAGRRHLIASAIEHEAVLVTLKALARRGWRTTLLPVGATGIVRPDSLEAALTDDTAIVSVMHANNEIGTIQPVAELAKLARARGALFHTDAVQSVGKVAVDARALGVDLLALSAHKFNGPKGAGALWIRRGVRIAPILTGGKHERVRRAGTENVAAIAGFGAVASTAPAKMAATMPRVAAMRDRLEAEILARVPGTAVNGEREPRVPGCTETGSRERKVAGICHLCFEDVDAESLLMLLDQAGLCASAGSSCSSGAMEPSHVLVAMGVPKELAGGSVRLSLGWSSTDTDVDAALELIPPAVEQLRRPR
ncbi:MAG: cysteine desulfurase [Chloroflexota bacterium]|nr:cysteine desulfurase [Chloroflexota bacterium]